MKKTLSILAIVTIVFVSIVAWQEGPDTQLNDYRMEAYYVDGGKEVYDLDSVTYFRAELHRVGYKVTFRKYEDGKNEYHLLGLVTRYRMQPKRPPYKNDTAHFRRYRQTQYAFASLLIIPVAVLMYKPKNKRKEL